MSLTKMLGKLAIAYVAAKGVQSFSRNGGMDGVRRKLAENKGSGGGLGGLLDAVGLGGGAGGNMTGTPGGDAGASGAGGIGGMLGGLAGVTGGAAGAQKMKGLLDTTKPVNDEEEAGLVIRAMVMAAKADGEIDETERRALWEVLGDADPSDRAFLDHALSAPVDVEALARDVPGGMEVEVYAGALMAIQPDNRPEAEFLDRLAKRLGISETDVNEIHTAQGKTPLYTV
ncbi:DUF533 domain-containing protein [Oceaniglobus indicus]|uniref:DUF533 domain-containing protein n=1 Tax=Oceaniglobus indicus TaxID=2047749 RepID=UPI000C1779E9|nr:DUF533 domain-containing protein [Oceaniglobus indicus]